MRYYLLREDEEIIVDLSQTKKITNELATFDFVHIDENKAKHRQTYYVRTIAGKFYISPDNVRWRKIPKITAPVSLLHVNKVYDLYRGYKPSGLGAVDAGALITQMPGKIIKIKVKEGDQVKKGDTLIILEAMKMENELKCGLDGTIKKIYIKEGQALDSGVLMMEIE